MTAPLGVYIHVPFCRHACPYCDFYKIELRERPSRERLEFPGRLAQEWVLLLRAEPTLVGRPLATIYLGGGTPSLLAPGAVGELLRGLGAALEVTLEANPENLVPSRCNQWREAGITRLSIGVQSFHDQDLARLERLHGTPTIHAAVANARAAGFGNISLDLMFALPGQSLEAWMDNLGSAIALGPQHISFYGLTVHERTPFHTAEREGRLVLPAEEVQAEMFETGSEFLRSAGYEHYEVGNFARPGFRSAHNQRYWLREDVVGLGPGAHSNLRERRWRNPDDMDAWKASLGEGALPRVDVTTPPPDIAFGEELFCALRRCEGVSLHHPRLGNSVTAWLQSPAGKRAVADGLATQSGETLTLTPRGWLVSDALGAGIQGSWEP